MDEYNVFLENIVRVQEVASVKEAIRKNREEHELLLEALHKIQEACPHTYQSSAYNGIDTDYECCICGKIK